ncbi:MAG: peptidylprolyl isomerase [Candidatus Gracilibacteria bacterium]|nr:peptidylprolyl isomerase [Candidatus Gracilibacteria bacterium]MDQ7022774.1 peptidylprolyl isomerase [Candidatus Gracilibacteria bacterium]
MRKTIIILSFLLLLTSCNSDELKLENKEEVKIVEETNSGKIQENNNLQTKEKIETMAKKENIQTAPLQEGDLVATMKTTNGTIKIKLFNKIVPNTVNNFVGLAQDKYYDGIIFHRVINNFMIQGGDPTGTGMGGESIYGEKFNDEFSSDLRNIKYSISMANSGKNTNGSQFFINQNNNSHLNDMHSVFGQVIEGMDNVEKIAKTKVGAGDKPKKEIKIIKLTIDEFDGKKLVEYKLDKEEAIKNYNSLINEKKESKKNKVLKNGDAVSVHYTLTVDGEKKDSSLDRGQPFTFTLGKKMVIKGWDEGLVGHKIGDNFKLEVEAINGYGELDETKIQVIPREQLKSFEDNGIKLEVGEKLPTQYGSFIIKIVTEKEITIDTNHELAGKKLFFDIEVIDIK